jgi:prefoldin, beta subunit, archaeal
MVDVNLGPYIQNQIQEADKLQKQLESLINQQYQLEIKLRENKKTLEYLSSTNENTEIFRAVGTILTKVNDIEGLKKELEEDVELTEMRLKGIKNQIDQINSRLKEISEEINKLYQKGNQKNA